MGQGKALRVLVCATKFPALSETFILDHITTLVDMGCDVEILAKWKENFPKTHKIVDSYRLLERTTYLSDLQKRIPEDKFRRLIAASGIIARNGIKNASAVIKSLDVFSLGRSALTLRPLLLTGFFLEKPHYDIIHCHYGPNGLLAANMIKSGVIKGKLVTSFHGYDLSRFVHQHGRQVYRSLFVQGDTFLPVNHIFKDELMRLGCDERKIKIHRMGIDVQDFSYAYREPGTDEDLKLLSVGRLVEKKGFQFAIEAIAKVIDRHPGAAYDIVGDGPERGNLEKTVNRYKLQKHVRLLGWKTRSEVVELMEKADLFLAPSVVAADGDSEGIPVVLMEAMAKGLPVISTNHGGIPELVQDHRNGYLVPERDIDALAKTIVEIVRHPDEVAAIAREARRRIEKDFNSRKQNARLVEIYTELAQGPRKK